MKKRFQTITSSLILSSILITNTLAVVKEIPVNGIFSANDMGSSDVQVSMDDVKEVARDYLNTDALTEYFHRSYGDPYKDDYGEELSWLIDNGIISRDQTVIVNSSEDIAPNVSVMKADLKQMMTWEVHRSDLLMYLYKAVFGPIYSRPIGLESSVWRTKDGTPVLLSDMIKDGGESWTYAPQSEEYESVFGDNNLFVSDVTINTENKTGDSQAIGDNSVSGDTSADVNYNSDYKKIEYKAGYDLIFYHTTDTLEPYLAAAKSKGLLPDDSNSFTPLFTENISNYLSNNLVPYWSSDAPGYIVNKSNASLINSKSYTVPSNLKEVLGTGWELNIGSNRYVLNRKNLFESNSGYFTSEDLTKADIYRYIYTFMNANEKKLSDLETSIVMYKYGMNLKGYGTEDDVKHLQYLIAKGVLDFDSGQDFKDLYAPVKWEDFISILYRVANPNARLDFSTVQLTDSDQMWQAKGFQPQSISLVDNGVLGSAETYSTVVDNGIYDDSEIAYIEGTPKSIEDLVNMYNAENASDGVTFRLTPMDNQSYSLVTADFSNINLGTLALCNTRVSVSMHPVMQCFSGNNSDIADTLFNSIKGEFGGISISEATRLNYLSNIWVIATLNDNPIHANTLMTGTPIGKGIAKDELQRIIDKEYTVSMDSKNILTEMKSSYSSERDAVARMRNFLTKVSGSAVTLQYKTTIKGQPKTLTVMVKFPAFDFLTSDNMADLVEKYNATKVDVSVTGICDSAGEDIKDVFAAVKSSVKTTTSSGTTIESATESPAGTGESTAPKAQQYIDPQGQDAFISWSAIQELCAQNNNISQVSEKCLYNSETDTYVYFSDEPGKKIALVGTSVVSGDGDLGVVFKDGEGSSGTVYYHCNAIRELLGVSEANSLSEMVTGAHCWELADPTLLMCVKKIPIMSESGFNNYSVYGFQGVSSGGVTEHTVEGVYVASSTANRAINMLSRRTVYNRTETEQNVAYLAVLFVPDTALLQRVSVPLSSNSTLQDLLNAASNTPTAGTDKTQWQANKDLCNAYCNWIYGTQNQTYVETGYLKPSAYYLPRGSAGSTPYTGAQSALAGLTESQKQQVKIQYLNPVNMSISDYTNNVKGTTAVNKTSGGLFVEAGERLYVNLGVYSDFTEYTIDAGGKTNIKLKNHSVSGSSTLVGNSFTVDCGNETLSKVPITISSIDSEGNVSCVVGPIKAIPYNGVLMSRNVYGQGGFQTMQMLQHSNTLIGMSASSSKAYTSMFGEFNGKVKFIGGVRDPSSLPASVRCPLMCAVGSPILYSGSNHMTYSALSQGNLTPQEYIDSFSGSNRTANSPTTGLINLVGSAGMTGLDSPIANVGGYFDISFHIGEMSIKNSKLVAGVESTSYISPFLFASVNDLIIDEMIANNSGAINVDKLPDGTKVEIGSGVYSKIATREKSAVFQGYSPTGKVDSPTLLNATSSFATEMIRAGNQYINISNFFTAFETLTESSSLNTLLQTMSPQSENSSRYWNGSSWSTLKSGNSALTTQHYIPIRFAVDSNIKAYPISKRDGNEESIYKIVTTVSSSSEGVFSKLPFWTGDLLTGVIKDNTLELGLSNFTMNSFAQKLRDRFMEEFGEAFQGDAITLLRMLFFIACNWVIVMVFLCYCIDRSRLKGFFLLIRDMPRPGEGIDIFRIITFGALSVDKEIRFSKILFFELILVGIIWVLWNQGLL